MRTYSFLWIGAVALTLGLTSMALTAWGGTYNFYFNNTEQGANSTANPAVTVTDGKVVKTEGTETAPGSTTPPATLPAAAALQESAAAAAASGQAAAAAVTPPATPLAAPVAAPAAASVEVQPNQSLAQVSDLEERQERRSYSARFTTSGVMIAQHTTKVYDYGGYAPYPGGSYTYDGYYHQRYGGAIAMGVYLGRRLAVNAFAGGYEDGGKMQGFAGGDLEFIPLTISIGKFDRLIEGGLLVGASTLRHAAGNPVSAHAGARVSFNFGDIGLTGVGRINQGVLVAEAGLSFRL